MLKAFDFESGNFFVAGSNPAVVDFSCINKISFHGSIWAAVFTFNPYLLISINGIIDINNSFIDINKYGHIIHLY